jgi:hypothetical protein
MHAEGVHFSEIDRRPQTIVTCSCGAREWHPGDAEDSSEGHDQRKYNWLSMKDGRPVLARNSIPATALLAYALLLTLALKRESPYQPLPLA